MGQCAPQSSDDSSIFSSLRKVGDKRFLVVHQRPRNPLVMIDLGVVNSVMRSQKDLLEQTEKNEAIVQNSILEEEEDCIEGNRSEISAVYSRVLSSAMPASHFSNTTSAITETTKVASNLDRYAAKKKFRKRMATPRLDALGENESAASNSSESTSSRNSLDNASDGTDQPNQKPGLPSLMFKQCFGREHVPGCSPQPQEETISEHLSNVLYLKMRANLVSFYENQYLNLFPNSPRPSGMDIDGEPTSPIDSHSRTRVAPTPIEFFDGVQSSPVLLDVDGSSFLDLAITGSLGLVDRSNEINSPPTVTPPSRKKSPKHYIVLLNRRSGIPLAVCALKSPNGPPVVRIFATKPRVTGQRQAASTLQLGLNWVANYPLYTWAEFAIEGGYKKPMQYSIYMATGSNGVFEKKPSYLGHHSENGSPDIMLTGRTPEKKYKGCALLSIKADNTKAGDAFFSLAVSRGVDPALFICFAAIVDETIEKNMRLQCELLKARSTNQTETYQTPTRKTPDQIPIDQATKTYF